MTESKVGVNSNTSLKKKTFGRHFFFYFHSAFSLHFNMPQKGQKQKKQMKLKCHQDLLTHCPC